MTIKNPCKKHAKLVRTPTFGKQVALVAIAATAINILFHHGYMRVVAHR